MKYLVTGVAGFIGMHVAKSLLNQNKVVIGIDNLNNYYDVRLKNERLNILKKYKKFKFIKQDTKNFKSLSLIFKKKIDYVIHLAAQAGVRYSIKKPMNYIKNNVIGFQNILDCSFKYKVKHLLYASSSSVYGSSITYPFTENQKIDEPLSMYAATKKTNELMAHTYSYLHKLPTTGLRFFTVYGPWGRPDMALFIFTKAILNNKILKVFNHGNMIRDFTYVDDIVKAIIKLIIKVPNVNTKQTPYKIFNIGLGRPIKIIKFIKIIEKILGKKSKIKFSDMQKGDVRKTYSDVRALKKWIGYSPKIKPEIGIKYFINWYKQFYKK
jgi:UDP-glucuronate 4-epimerase